MVGITARMARLRSEAGVALARRVAYSKLRNAFKERVVPLVGVAGQRAVLQAFDASPFVGVRFDQDFDGRWVRHGRSDMLLPSRASLVRVEAELVAAGIDGAAAIVDDLAAASEEAISGFPKDAGGDVVLHKASPKTWTVSYGGQTYAINDKRFAWLRRAHEQARHGNPRVAFEYDLFKLLAHYDALQDGNQAAIPKQVAKAFERWAVKQGGNVIEAFASGLNHRLTKRSPVAFGTFFPEVDKAFGGVGPFYHERAFEGPGTGKTWKIPTRHPMCARYAEDHRLLLCNPPFAPEGLGPLAESVRQVLEFDDRTTCVVVTPRFADDAPHLVALRALGPLAESVLEPHRHTFERPTPLVDKAKPADHPYFATSLMVFSSRPKAKAYRAEVLLNSLAQTWALAAQEARIQRRRDEKKKRHRRGRRPPGRKGPPPDELARRAAADQAGGDDRREGRRPPPRRDGGRGRRPGGLESSLLP